MPVAPRNPVRRAHDAAPKSRRSARPGLWAPLSCERLEDRAFMAGLPFGALPQDTGEYMLGEVYVNVVLLESTGTGANNTENWTIPRINAAKARVTEGLQWWEDTLALALGANPNPNLLNFQIDFTRANSPVGTSIEPISRISNDFELWIVDFFNTPDVKSTLTAAGLTPTSSFSDNIKAFNNAQRLAHNADWAFTIFIVNDFNDPNDQFAPGGDHAQSFAFAGGQFFVTLDSRPNSAIAHETGHMFWARDEHSGAGRFTDHRGYYDTQNTNAELGNPNPASIVPSIMARHEEAFANTVLTGPNGRVAISTIEQLGWRDGDNDGIFDVLDVPHSLTGSGNYDASTGRYRFVGKSTVRALPNQNPLFSAATPYAGSLQNDITINRLSRVEFRLNGPGNPWQTALTLADRPTAANLNFSVDVPANFQSIEIRTIDDRTQVTSDVFSGGPAGITSTLQPGINGFVRHDADGNGQFAASELGLFGWTVRLVTAPGQPLVPQKRVEPDDFPQDTVLNTVPGIPEITLTAVGDNVGGPSVVVRNGDLHPTTGQPMASTLSRVFRRLVSGSTTTLTASWTEDARLRIDFSSPVTTVSLDAVANSAGDLGRLEAFDENDQLVARYTTKRLGLGQFETMTVSAAPATIKYVVAKGHAETSVSLDNLRFGANTSTTTDLRGAYSLPFLPSGSYLVEAVPPTDTELTTAATRSVAYGGAGQISGIDFGGRFSEGALPLQNPVNRFDVDGNDTFDIRDVFALISAVRSLTLPAGGLPLPNDPPFTTPPPFVDVVGDNLLDSHDVFTLIAAFRSSVSGGDGFVGGGGSGGESSGGNGGEGEFVGPASRESVTKSDSARGPSLSAFAARPFVAEHSIRTESSHEIRSTTRAIDHPPPSPNLLPTPLANLASQSDQNSTAATLTRTSLRPPVRLDPVAVEELFTSLGRQVEHTDQDATD